MHVVDHAKGAPVQERRRVLAESARIVRGQLRDLAGVRASELDALVFPGGFGVAKNLCTFATEGRNMRVNPEVERIVREMHSARKPMGFVCIAPVLAGRLLGDQAVKVTIGNDHETAAAIEAWGARHVDCKVEDVVVDERLRVLSTPAYMLGPWIAPVALGIDKLVSALLEMA
jgi:enhancing lycopene biosynthesis protein 2